MSHESAPQTKKTAMANHESARFDSFGQDIEAIEKIEPFFEWAMENYFSLNISGAENIPANSGAVLVANHAGALPWDALMLSAALRKNQPQLPPVRPLLEDAVMTAPFLGKWMTRMGCVRASQDNAIRLLNDKAVVTVFPEGMLGLSKVYRKRYKLVRFGRAGFVRLAVKTKAPLIPVTILGAEDSAPLLTKVNVLFKNTFASYFPVTPTFPLLGPLGLLPLPAQWTIHIGEPILTDAMSLSLDDDLGIGQIADEIRDGIQDKLDELVANRHRKYTFRLPF
jgi:1-acyl-sn-glycerol-3-phosphate acyltransferase